MKFNEKQPGPACAITWDAAMLVEGLASIVWKGYGQDFLRVMASVYHRSAECLSLGTVLRRDSAQLRLLQVGTPSFGRSHRVKTT